MSGVRQRPRRLGPSGLVQSRLGKRLRYLLLGSPRPQMQGSRLRRGREAPATAAAAARPPSLPPSSSPSLPLSLPRAPPLAGPSRGQPVLDQIQFRRPGPGPAAAEVCRPAASPTPAAEPRALRAPHSGPPPPGSPNTKQTSRSFLQTQHPVGRLAAGLSAGEPAPLHLRPKSSHNPPCPCSRGPARTPFRAKAPADHPRAAALPGAAHLLPCRGPTQSPVSRRPHPQPLLPGPAALHLFSRRAASPSQPRQGGGPGRRVPGAEVPGRPQMIRRLSRSPPQPARDLRDQGSPWQALASSSFSRKS